MTNHLRSIGDPFADHANIGCQDLQCVNLTVTGSFNPPSAVDFKHINITDTLNQITFGTGAANKITLSAPPATAGPYILTLPHNMSDTVASLSNIHGSNSNQLTPNIVGDVVTLSLPQDIATTSDVEFKSVKANGLTASQIVKTDGSKKLVSASTISLASEVSGVLPIANGGNNSSSALVNGKLMVSNAGAIVEGTSSSAPAFSNASLSDVTNQLVLGTTNTSTINAIAPASSQVINIQDSGQASADVILSQSGSQQLIASDLLISHANPTLTVSSSNGANLIIDGGGGNGSTQTLRTGAGNANLINMDNGAGTGWTITEFGSSFSFVDNVASKQVLIPANLPVNSNAVVSSGTQFSQLTNINTSVTADAGGFSITTQAASTAGLAVDSFTVNNSYVTANSSVLCTVGAYSGVLATNGTPYITISSIGVGSFVVNISNVHPTNALAGTLKLGFLIAK